MRVFEQALAAALGVALRGEATHTQPQLVHGEGLRHVIGGARLHRRDGAVRARVGRHEDDLGRCRQRSRRAQHGETVHLRHPQVRHHDVEPARRKPCHGLPATADADGLVAVELQRLRQELPQLRLVVRHQDARHCFS